MSRSPIPANKKNAFVKAFRQVCIYSFPNKLLKDFSNLKSKSFLEEIEDIEILRFLEMGYDVKMIELSGCSIAVDVPDDIEKVINRINS